MGLLKGKHEPSSREVQTHPVTDESELSDIWRKLLGVSDNGSASDTDSATGSKAQSPVPVVDDICDPWRELLHAHGVEIVDLQQCRPQTVQVSFSEQEVEQALQILQEY